MDLCCLDTSWEKNINLPAVVLFDEQHSIRTVSEGFVDHILVKEGDLVVPGQLLLELVNKETKATAES